MLPDHITRSRAVPIRYGVVTLSGYGVKVAVDRRHLAVSDGVGRQRREARFAKAPSRLKRLLVIAQTGFVTLEALRWLSDAGAAFIQLDHEGVIQAATVSGLDDARLRRAQALIPSTEHALPMAKLLMMPKIRGQLSVLDSFGLDGSLEVGAALKAVDCADKLEVLLRAEARAAEAYWGVLGLGQHAIRAPGCRAGSLAPIRLETIAADARVAQRREPAQRPAQLSLRFTRGRNALGPGQPRAGSRPRPVPRGQGEPPVLRSRRHGTGQAAR